MADINLYFNWDYNPTNITQGEPPCKNITMFSLCDLWLRSKWTLGVFCLNGKIIQCGFTKPQRHIHNMLFMKFCIHEPAKKSTSKKHFGGALRRWTRKDRIPRKWRSSFLSGERIAIPQGLLPKIVMKEVKPEDISKMISSKRVGPKILTPVLNYGSEFDIWVVFLAIFLASVGALNPGIFKSVAPGTHRQQRKGWLLKTWRVGVKKVAEANQEHEVFTFNVVTSFLMTGFLSGGDVATAPKCETLGEA